MRNRGLVRPAMVLGMVMLMACAGCRTGSHAGEGARRGGTYGAFGGAVSGFFWGLFSGDPLRRAAQGAVVGGATGATVGAVHGSGRDRELKAEYGETNYKGLMALVQRDYPAAREYTAQTAEDPNPKYRHASAWISALIASETLGRDKMGPYYRRLIETDPGLETIEDARVEVRLAERDLKSLRKQLNAR